MLGFRTIVLSGGGINGFCHLGFLQKLRDERLDRHVDTYIGTSIGAFISTLICIGYTPDEIFAHSRTLDDSILTYKDMSNFFLTLGAESGEYIIAFLKTLFIKKKIHPNINFQRLKDLTKKRLFLVGTNLDTEEPVYFGSESHLEMSVIQAVRISISIPLLISAVSWSDNIHVDGAVTDNYPIEYAFDDFTKRYPELVPHASSYIIGCLIDSRCTEKVQDFKDYFSRVISCCLRKTKWYPFTVSITTKLKTNSISFNATDAQRKELYDIGKTFTERYLASSGLSTMFGRKIDDSSRETLYCKCLYQRKSVSRRHSI